MANPLINSGDAVLVVYCYSGDSCSKIISGLSID